MHHPVSVLKFAFLYSTKNTHMCQSQWGAVTTDAFYGMPERETLTWYWSLGLINCFMRIHKPYLKAENANLIHSLWAVAQSTMFPINLLSLYRPRASLPLPLFCYQEMINWLSLYGEAQTPWLSEAEPTAELLRCSPWTDCSTPLLWLHSSAIIKVN